MAEDLVDHAGKLLGGRRPVETSAIALGLTAPLHEALEAAGAEASELGLSKEVGHRLVYRFGDDWSEGMRLIARSPDLGQPAVDSLPVLRVELELARSREMAMTDDDVLVRRTRLTTLDQSTRSLAAS
jgi:glycerol-3-phosphate dehydrogenase